MVTNKHQVAVNSLSSSNVDERKQAVRFIKNAIIGNRTKKELYLTFGIAPRLVEYLKAQNDYDLKIQAAVVLGSFAFGDEENIAPLVEAGSIAPLLSCLSPDNDIRLVEASAKALRSLFQSVNTPRKDITNNDQHVENLITLLSPNSLLNISSTTSKNTLAAAVRVSEVVASIIARAVVHPREQDVFFNAGSIPFLVELLDEKWCTWPKLREAALDALAALCKGNEKISAVVAHSKTSTNEESISLIIRLTKDKRSTMRILAATCVVNMIKTSAITNTVEIIPSILLTIINLFADTSVLTSLSMSVQEKAPIVFAYLITDSESLQKAAMEGDAILKLSGLVADCIKEQNSYLNIEPIIASPVVSNQINRGRIESISNINAPNTSSLNNDSSESERKIAANSTTFHTETVLENSFIALAAACSLNEDCRKQVIEAKLIPLMISSLAHPNKKIRASSCTLAKSLSRSIKNLRTHLVESGIAIPLVKLLLDSSVSVQVAASATICNIVLDFSPLKKMIIENGGIEKLVSLVLTSNSQVLQSSHMDIDGEAAHIDESSSSLRLNCLWALKNLLYQSDSEIKTRVMKELHWDNLKLLFDDADINIQEQAFNILRNIVCVKEEDIEQAFVNIGATNLIKILERKLQSADTSEQIILQILYIIVNICSGSERQKSYIINSDVLLDQIKKNLAYKTSKVKIAAIWCIINLTWSDDLGCKERVAKLKTCGINELLTSMRSSAVLDLDVKERVKTALKQFGVASHRTTGLVDNIQHGNSSGTDDMVIDSASSQVSDSSRFGIIFGELLQGRGRRDRGDVDEEEPSEEEESEGEEYM